VSDKNKRADIDIFKRFKGAIIDFFREEPVKNPSKAAPKKKSHGKSKSASKKKKVKKTSKKDIDKPDNKNPPEPPKRKPEEVPMPAPWSKVTKYKKVKTNNYYFL